MDISGMGQKLFRELGVDFIGSLSADIINTLLFRGKAGKLGEAQKIKDLIKAKKIDEALQVIDTNWIGFGEGDEELLLTDLLTIKSEHKISTAQLLALCGWLGHMGQTDPKEAEKLRKRFRNGHMKNPDVKLRRLKLIRLAKLPDDAARTVCFKSAGFMDPNLWEQFDAQFDSLFEGSDVKLAATKAKLRSRFGLDEQPDTRPEWLKKHPRLQKVLNAINLFH